MKQIENDQEKKEQKQSAKSKDQITVKLTPRLELGTIKKRTDKKNKGPMKKRSEFTQFVCQKWIKKKDNGKNILLAVAYCPKQTQKGIILRHYVNNHYLDSELI